MTEVEWLLGADPQRMLPVACAGADVRKIRLFALSCCRRVEYLLSADDVKRCRRAIALLERRIEGSVSEEDLQTALIEMVGESMDAGHSIRHPGEASLYAISSATYTLECLRRGEWATLARTASEAIAYDALARSGGLDLEQIAAPWKPGAWRGEVEWRRDEAAVQSLPVFVSAWEIERSHQAKLLRDIFGNRFHPTTFSPECRTDTVVVLARQMYESREFSALPILADALQDAGCDSDDILAHCRGTGPHVRGCWVVDLVLGKV